MRGRLMQRGSDLQVQRKHHRAIKPGLHQVDQLHAKRMDRRRERKLQELQDRRLKETYGSQEDPSPLKTPSEAN